MHNKILSLFNFSLETDFAKVVLEQDSEVNLNGDFVRIFTRRFQDKKYRLFEEIAVKDFGTYTNIILRSKRYSIFCFRGLKKLINDLYSIYGSDHLKGKYSYRDFHDLSDKEMDFVSLRNWSGIENELLPVHISIDKEIKTIEMVIFAAKINSEIKKNW